MTFLFVFDYFLNFFWAFTILNRCFSPYFNLFFNESCSFLCGLFNLFWDILDAFSEIFFKHFLPVNRLDTNLLFLSILLFIVISWFLSSFICFLFFSSEIFHWHKFQIRWLNWLLINHTHKLNLLIFIVSRKSWLDVKFERIIFGVNLIFGFTCLSYFIKLLLKSKTNFIKFLSFLWWILFDGLLPNFLECHVTLATSGVSSLVEASVGWFHSKLISAWMRNKTSHSSCSSVISLNTIIHRHITLTVQI